MRSKESSGSIILPVAILAVVVVFMGLVIYNQLKHHNALNEMINAQAAQIDGNRTQIENLTAIKSSQSELQRKAEFVEGLLPEGPEENDIIERIERMASRANVRLQKITFDQRVPKTGYTEMPLKLFFTGGYAGMQTLLEDLNTAKRLFTVGEVSVNAGTDSSALAIEISAKAFFISK
ncbi:type IV pilus assembly protein PilO [Anaerobacterium chartisolvens]|uniref:Type IV pilus assembly protein PilO n=1 Tax=Anaerobacterium chartisolvens TaxID=1297424 RepID=A0A369B036_9FIRM|nr:type 4a pilus biogenesis protein PilO [Anaerobacterium chartisolvens]RCX13796.1 type IV pilus assembly protein PilO [Anaerobacterium chartisolvens]